ncbi:hypothetical protein [Deinococcus sp.]|uniref:hypothetical protein n=1 Tax=Deinococcus sp. TaxID=47478 RepID=UPI003C7E2CB8
MKKLVLPSFLLPLLVAACGSSEVNAPSPSPDNQLADADGSTLVTYVQSGSISLKDLKDLKVVKDGRQLTDSEVQALLKEEDKRLRTQATTGSVICSTGAALRKAFPSGRYYTRLIATCPSNVTITYMSGYAYIYNSVTGENARGDFSGSSSPSFWVDSGVITRRAGYYEANGQTGAQITYVAGGTQYSGTANYNEPGLQLYGDGN